MKILKLAMNFKFKNEGKINILQLGEMQLAREGKNFTVDECLNRAVRIKNYLHHQPRNQKLALARMRK